MNAFVAERLRRYVQVVVNFVGVGSSPTECSFFFVAIGEEQKAKIGGTGIRARVKRITTAYANHYTIPPRPIPGIFRGTFCTLNLHDLL
jgi:hypothetical protein